MKKNMTAKVLIILLIGIMFAMLFKNTVKATSIEQIDYDIDKILETEEKIMKYDARTNEITEVNMEELEQVLKMKKNINSEIPYSTMPYIPNEIYSDNAKINLFSTDRERVNNTSIYPYKQTCRIEYYEEQIYEANAHRATASIVGPKVALTAAHCVFNENQNNAVYRNWTLYPGYNDGTYYGTACGWDQVYYSDNWMNNHTSEDDWAICVLQSDVGNQIGWLRCGFLWF